MSQPTFQDPRSPPQFGFEVTSGGGTRYIKKVGMLVENFEIDP